MEKECIICNNKYYVRPSHMERSKYCGINCAKIGWKGQQRSVESQFKKGSKGFTQNHSLDTRQKMRTLKVKQGTINKAGYKLIIPELGGKQIREHRVVWEKVNGEIPQGCVIHHKDGNKLNNVIENLQQLTISAHTKLHWQQRDIRGGLM